MYNRPPFLLHPGLIAFVAFAISHVLHAAPAPEKSPGAALLQELKSFNTVATVLHIAAHPDDENTQLITYFARARGYRTAYLSVTRGDGGQNEIGPEFDEKLGVARSQELLAARRIDGGRQFFTRAIDFGFSKTAEETLSIWDREQVLGDVVRVIRKFRPDVIITRFSPSSSGMTHGHHTSSGILGVEAFKLAGDPKAYPEQLTQGLTVWQPKRVVLNAGGPGGRGGGSGKGTSGAMVSVDIGGDDPVTGEALSSIASRSRGQHVTQFGNRGGGGRGGGGGGSNVQGFVLMGGEPAKDDLMDGIDTKWTRYPGGAEVGTLTDAAIAAFQGDNPAASVPALLVIRQKLAALPEDPVIADKRDQLDGIIQRCLGLEIATRSPIPEVVPGESVKLGLSASVRSAVPVKWASVKTVTGVTPMNVTLTAGRPATRDYLLTVPRDTPVTHPYWLREEGSAGIAKVSDPKLIGTAENPPALPIDYAFEVGGQTLLVHDEPVNIGPAGGKGPARRKLDVISPVSLVFGGGVAVFTPGATKPISIEVTAAHPNASGTLQLDTPAGWKVSPPSQPFRLGGVGEKTKLTFSVTAPAQTTNAKLTARATVNGKDYFTQRSEIRYNHIPVQLLQAPARVRAIVLDLNIRGRNVGYLPGAGDDTAAALEQLGYRVTVLQGADLTPEKLRGLDAVVVGVRAFNERDDLATNIAGLLSYVENGGTVIAQYNRGDRPLKVSMLGPYPLTIPGTDPKLRVTDERAPVTLLAPEEAVLNKPNRISAADFDGWVQERGAYFPSSWDAKYVPILAMNDPGDPVLKSSLLVARYGKGYYVYTGLAFFRQLPAGVPGAYRLFANLVSLGK